MNNLIFIDLGKRVNKKVGDKSCEYGVVFGQTVVEVDHYFVSVCFHDVPTENVLAPKCNLFVLHSNGMSAKNVDQRELAYANVKKITAIELERLLRNLIDGLITYEQFESEKRQIEDRIKNEEVAE